MFYRLPCTFHPLSLLTAETSRSVVMRESVQSIHRAPCFPRRAARTLDRVHLRTREGHSIVLPGQRLHNTSLHRKDRRRLNRAPIPGTFLDIRV